MSGIFASERAVVIGAGVAGSAAAEALAAEGAEVRVSEDRPHAALGGIGPLEALGVEVRAGGHEPSHLDGATLVVASPGVPPDAEVLAWARDRGVPLWGEMELGARLARVPYIAVTGTNGKTTTTAMIATCLSASGLDAVACGNIGRPFTSAAREKHDVLVVEVSSYQLTLQESLHPRISVLLNVSPDHLDWHGSFGDYAAAKTRVFAAQRGDDVHLGNRDDPDGAAISAGAPCRIGWFRLGAPDVGEIGYMDGDLVSRIDEDASLGPIDEDRPGYRVDAAAAAAAAIEFGADPRAVRRGLGAFEPPRHRGETVAELGGVRFIDNSKATNVHAALASIDAVDDAVLIAGGRAKGQDLSSLGSRARRLAGVVAMGESAEDVARVFEGLLPVRFAGSIEEATRLAFELAPARGAVLLAPACASWDQFRDYAERGDRFAAAARVLLHEVGSRD
jgi:UDP-N-acetylmuramoylalanine--D-glutamate ligase